MLVAVERRAAAEVVLAAVELAAALGPQAVLEPAAESELGLSVAVETVGPERELGGQAGSAGIFVAVVQHEPVEANVVEPEAVMDPGAEPVVEFALVIGGVGSEGEAEVEEAGSGPGVGEAGFE